VKRIEAAIDTARENDEPLLLAKDGFSEEDIPQYKASALKLLDDALVRVEAAIVEGSKAMKKCKGLEKAKEALADLDCKRRYSLNIKVVPAAPSLALLAAGESSILAGKPVFDFFGIPNKDWNLTLARSLQSEWELHRKAYIPPPKGTFVGPAAAMEYWRDIGFQGAPSLSKWATFRLLRPNGNAAPERLMSLLTHMDQDNAQSTKPATMGNILFLRGNAAIVRILLKEAAEERVMATEVSHKRRRVEQDQKLKLTMAALLANAHKKAVATVDEKGEGEEREEGRGKEGGEVEEATLSSGED
jgi:hypothetical protein